MSYTVLARRWRPQRFEEVIGQRHVTQTLQNAISADRVAHAYLFTGARGVGKTTVARILAKALNCAEGPTPLPCGRCDSCVEITEGVSLDVQEIDGASNTGVDDVRDLRESLRYGPAKGRFRVYIIDEVHMLSNAAFNALLKTLEEPPAHVVFIFATTEPHKIPATILSRCQRFDFKRISLLEIISQLERICEAEGIQASRDVFSIIAREAEGSLRDAQSLLDQAVSYAGQRLEEAPLREVLGVLDRAWLLNTSEALIGRNPGGCLEQVEGLFQHGHSLTYFYHQLVEHLRNLIVVAVDADPGRLLHLPDHELETLRRQAGKASLEDLQLWFDILIRAEEEIRRSQYPRYLLEMLLVKMACLDRTEDLGDLVDRIESLAQGGGTVDPGGCSEPVTAGDAAHDAAFPAQREPSAGSWKAFLDHLRSQRPALASVMEQGAFLDCSEHGVLRLRFPSAFHVDQVSRGDKTLEIEAQCRAFFGRPIKLLPVYEQGNSGNANNHAKRQLHEMQVKAKAHPLVQEALQIFGGRVVEIKPPAQTREAGEAVSGEEGREVHGEDPRQP